MKMAGNEGANRQLKSSSAITFCDDSEAKLANQDEEFKLVTTVDTLQSRRFRRRANMAHAKYELKRTLVKMESQRDILHKARADNVFQKHREQEQSESDKADEHPHESKAHVTFASETSVQNIESLNTDTDPLSNENPEQPCHSEKPVLPVSEPMFTRRPSTTSPTNLEDRKADDKTEVPRARNSSAPAFRVRSRMTRKTEMRRLSDGIALEELESADHAATAEELFDIQLKTVASSEKLRSNEFPSLAPEQAQEIKLRPKTASAAVVSGRSRRDLFRLTHIDAIAAAELELRRRLWLSQLAERREIEQAHLRSKIDEFIAKVEADKKRWRKALGRDSILNAEFL